MYWISTTRWTCGDVSGRLFITFHVVVTESVLDLYSTRGKLLASDRGRATL